MAIEAQASRDYINIQTVTVEPIDASGILVVPRRSQAHLTLDMENGTVTNIDGNSSVQLQLSQIVDGTQIFPTLYIRVNTETSVLMTLTTFASCISYSWPDYKSESTRIRIMTDCG